MFGSRLFRGGLKLPENKSADISHISPLTPREGEEFFIPFLQHIGAPALPVVKKGEEIPRGGLLAVEAQGISARVHSPVSGVATFLGKVLHPVSGWTEGCVIKALSQGEGWERIPSGKTLAEIAAFAGIVGLGGAGFPSRVKLSSGRAVDTILINAAECEPYLTCDHALIMAKSDEILKAVKVLKEEFGASAAVIALEDNKKNAAKLLEKSAFSYGVDIVLVPARYPQGGEKQLIKAVLGRTVPPGKLPVDFGVLIHNVATVFALYEALFLSKPLYERVVTVSGDAENPGNFLVPIGSPAGRIVKFSGNNQEEYEKIIFGGPMTGTAEPSLDVPVIKTTGGILLFKSRKPKEVMPCLRCGRCAEVCVMGLSPRELESFFIAGHIDKMIKGGILNCIECGCCSYVCPSGRFLTESIKTGKRFAAAALAKKKALEGSGGEKKVSEK